MLTQRVTRAAGLGAARIPELQGWHTVSTLRKLKASMCSYAHGQNAIEKAVEKTFHSIKSELTFGS